MKKSQAIFFKLKDSPSIFVDYDTWNQVIRDIRKRHKLTQLELGQEFNYSSQQIARFESGKVEPPIDFWKKFSTKFGVCVKWLLFGEGPAHECGPSDPSILKQISTKEIQAELKERQQLVDGFRVRADEIRKQLHKEGPQGESFVVFRERVKEKQKGVIPQDAPEWLIEDLKDIHLL